MNVVITGASRGIGRSIAEIFGEHGHHLFLIARNETSLLETAEELRAAYPNITIEAQAFRSQEDILSILPIRSSDWQ